MMQTVLFLINDGNKEKVEVSAFSKKDAMLTITAASMDAAQELLLTGLQQSQEAMRNWKPQPKKDPEEPKPKAHYIVQERSVEEMAEAAEKYETTPGGKRFAKSIENALQFTYTHGNNYGGLTCGQLNYLADKHQNNLINGSFDIWALAYRLGHKDGVKASKKKGGQ